MKLGCCALTIKERLKIAWRICGKSCVAEASSYAFLSQVFWVFYFFSLLGIVSAETLLRCWSGDLRGRKSSIPLKKHFQSFSGCGNAHPC